ncbi:hypothetical protein NL676_007201 [Syzygium grande]|nr:hypothetical protein NL676_007201 [Syzygium grande]
MAIQNMPANDQNGENMGLMPVLPPGFCFFPSDEEIFCYYLMNKNDHPNPRLANRFDHNVIKELDVYGKSPSELAEYPYFEYSSGEPTRHWYFYTAARGSDERQRRMRAVSDGFWLMRGRGNEAIVGGGGEVLGSFRGLSTFAKPWTGNSSSGARNDGVLTYEAAPRSNHEDMTSGNDVRLVTEIHNHVSDGQIPAPIHLNQTIYRNSTVNHHHGDTDGAGNFDADFAAPPTTAGPAGPRPPINLATIAALRIYGSRPGSHGLAYGLPDLGRRLPSQIWRLDGLMGNATKQTDPRRTARPCKINRSPDRDHGGPIGLARRLRSSDRQLEKNIRKKN